MIETKGLIGAMKATDRMLKAVNVTLLKQEKVGASLVVVYIEGDVSAVKSALQAGVYVLKESDQLIAHHMIARTTKETKDMLTNREDGTAKKAKASSKKGKKKEGKSETNPKVEKNKKPK